MERIDLYSYALEEFANAVNNVSDPDFYESLKRKDCNINWINIYNILKGKILEELTETWNYMWKNEDMDKKMKDLEQYKEIFSDKENIWKSSIGDIGTQRLNLDISLQIKMKDFYSKLADEEEAVVLNLKEELLKDWEKLKNYEKRLFDANSINMKLFEAIAATMEQNVSQLSTYPFID